MKIESIGTPFLWAAFIIFVLLLLAIDLGIFHRKAHKIRVKEALTWTLVWIGFALAFNLLVWLWFGHDPALEFLSGYLIEKALSVDNLFIFIVIFSYFSVPEFLQHRVLFWGIIGALLLRALLIVAGAALLQKYHWLVYIFGIFLLWTGVRLLFEKASQSDPGKNFLVRIFWRFVPMTKDFHGTAFIVKKSGQYVATPLLLVLLTVEATDLVFAVDSIPAIFAITTDPFIVFTSNIFAVLGLRALYFALAHAMSRFHYLRVGLALILLFVGSKMLLSTIVQLPIYFSLLVICFLLGSAIVASLLFPPKNRT
ncbi:MAG: TerC family protein [Myxococcales bacterium]|nr:TerC family protein [Myxococcales bacterium]USN50316.1 MAG: TerC family protein [Myxococcales bacterium]